MRSMIAAAAMVVVAATAAAAGAAPTPAHYHPGPYEFLDMEHHKPKFRPGVTSAADRLGPSAEAGGPAIAYRPGERGRVAPGVRPRMFRTGVRAGEPTLGVTKKGTIFFQALDGGPMVVRSTNGGRTWKDVSPMIAGRNAHPESLDPFLWVDYSTGRVFTYDFLFGCSEISYSDDEGKTWTTTPLNCGLQDHQNLFTGPPAISPTVGYENVVYTCSNQAGATIYSVAAQCLKSLDGGISWAPTGAPAFVTSPEPENDLGVDGYCHGAVGHGYVGPDGTVYVPKGFCGQPWLAISHDEGATWERVQVANNGVPQTNIGVYEHETSVAVDRAGNVYYFWMSKGRMPYMAVSRNGGTKWSKPIPVAPRGVKEATLPHITVGGNGKVAAVYYASTNSPGKPFHQYDDCKDKMVDCFSNLFFLNPPDPEGYERTTWNGYMTVSGNALAKRPTFHSVTVNDPKDPLVRGSCGPIRCKAVYDFIDVVIDKSGKPWAAYVDACIQACAEKVGPNQGNEGFVGTMAGGPNLR